MDDSPYVAAEFVPTEADLSTNTSLPTLQLGQQPQLLTVIFNERCTTFGTEEQKDVRGLN